MRSASILFSFTLLFSFYCCTTPEHQYRIQKDGLYGFIDERGYETIRPQYKYVGHFTNEGYALVISKMEVSKTEKSMGQYSISADTLLVNYGYINTNNETVVPFNQALKVSFHDLKTFWFIDNPAELVDMYNLGELAFTHRVLGELEPVESKYLYQDQQSKLLGYKTIDGKVVCSPQFDYGTHYQNSLAVVIKSKKSLFESSSEHFDVNAFLLGVLNNKGAINANGKQVIPCEYLVLDDFAKNGTTWAASMHFDKDGNEKMDWVRIDKEGNILMGPMGSSVVRYWNSNEDRYLMRLHLADMWFYTYIKDSKTFLTDFNHDGTITIAGSDDQRAEVFQDATGFRDGIAAVKTDYWYIIDKDFNNLSGPYDSVKVMSDGLIAAKKILRDKDNQPVGNWGYLNKTMNTIIPFVYSDCGNFNKGLAWYKKEEPGTIIMGYINKQGKSVWDSNSKAKNNYMTWVVLSIVAICLVVISLITSKNEKRKKHYETIREQYPDGVREWRGKQKMSDSDAYRLVDSSIEEIQQLDSAEKERMRIINAEHARLKGLYPHGYKRFTRMHFTPPPKDFQAMETIIAHLENEYLAAHEEEETANRIKEEFPNGFRIWSRNHPNASNEVIIQNESAIQNAEADYQVQHRAELERRRREEEERQRLNSLSSTLKADAPAILKYLRDSGVTCLYHFTDRRNLDSIRRNGGLFSWKYCDNHNITGRQGGSEQSQSLDVRHGLQDYVRLSFCDDHPMMYRLGLDGYDLVLLKIDIQVAAFEGTRFSTINATDNGQENGPTLQDLKKVNIGATQRHYISRSDTDFKPHQAEVLVKTFVPSRYILNLDSPISVPTPRRREADDFDDVPF
jgi:hypothetical protein